MTKEEFLQLAEKISSGSANDSEIAQYNNWFNSHHIPTKWDESLLGPREQKATSILKSIRAEISAKSHYKKRHLWYRVAAAASIIFCISIGAYFGLKKQPDESLVVVKTKDILPGGNKAVLTLANGKKIILANTHNGKIAQQGKITVTMTQAGKIVYQDNGKQQENEAGYNTTTTPRGGQFHVVLADGSNVWLNAASSITYPTEFKNKDRTVEITGEAYFEVFHDAARPFRVKCHGQTVEVLGTHFNINAYDDEKAVTTTLLEGSVKIITDKKDALLKPGDQSQLALIDGKYGMLTETENADIDAAVAWKNGHFKFDKADIKTILRQFSRWYNVEVVYEGKIDDRVFSGSIYRNLKASNALEILSFANIHFTIDDRKIIVSNNK